MGQEELKLNKTPKLTINEEKKFLVNILTKLMHTNIAIMELYKKIAVDEKSVEICDKSIEQCNVGLVKIRRIKHIDILRSLYGQLIANREPYFASSGSLCSYEKIDEWDNDEEKFNEFMESENKDREEIARKQQEVIEQRDKINKAREEGKKVEMLYDEKTKTMKPVIVDDIENKA